VAAIKTSVTAALARKNGRRKQASWRHYRNENARQAARIGGVT